MSLGITAPFAAISGAAFKSAGDFEQSMNVMAQVTGATAGQIEQMQAQALELGASTAFSAGEAAEAMLELGKAGLEPNEIMGAIGGTMDLAAAGGLDLAQAATIAANAMNAFQLPAEDVTEVANMLAAAANASSADVTDLAAGMQMAGAVFASNGQSINDLAAGMAILANNGIAGSDAGTSLKTMLMRLAAPTDEAAAVMSDLGIQVFNADGSMRDFADMVGSLEAATKGLTDQQRSMALTTIFGADAIRAATILAEEGADGFADMQKAVTKEGAASATAAARMKGLNGAIEYLKGSIDSFLINAALPFLESKAEMIRKVADLITAFGALPEPIKNTAISIAAVLAAAGPLLLIGSKLIPMFSLLGTVLGAIASPIGLVVVAVGALVAAFATDFMGVRTAVTGMVDSLLEMAGIDLGGIIEGVKSFGNYIGFVLESGDPLNDWLTHLPEPIQPAVLALGQLVAAFGNLTATGDVGAFINDITAIDWGGALTAAGESLNKLKDGMVAALQKIDWGAALATAGDWLAGLTGGVVSAVQSVDWGAALTTAGEWLAGLTSGVVGAVTSIDWGGALTTAGEWLSGLTGGVVGAIQSIDWGGALTTAGDFLANLSGGMAAKLRTIDWGGMFTTAGSWLLGFTQGVVNRIRTINWGGLLAEAGDFLANLWGAVSGALSRIDWAGALTAAGTWLANLSAQVVTAIQGIDWNAALTNVGNAFATLETAVADALRGLGFTAAAASLDSIKEAAGGLPQAIADAKGAFDGFLESVKPVVTQVATFLAPAVGRLQTAIGNLPEKMEPLLPKLQEMGAAFGRLGQALQPVVMLIGGVLVVAAEFGINRLTTLFETLPELLEPIISQVTATINLISTILEEVVEIIEGIINGDWKTVWESARTIAGEFVTFFRELFARLGTFMRAVARNISEPILQTLKTLGVDIVTPFTNLYETFAEWWNNIVETFKPVMEAVESIKGAIDEFATWINGLKITPPWEGWSLPNLGGSDGNPLTPYAAGGAVTAGVPISVGERGREMFIPNTDGLIVPHHELDEWGALAGAGMGGNVVIQNATIGSEVDLHALAYQVAELLRRRR
jgi:TP901 family phage tail tape measure protein